MDLKLKKLLGKTAFFILSLSLAWWLVKSDYLQSMIDTILPLRFVSEVVAGIFYTSFLASPLSVAMLIILAQTNNPVITAMLAGVGTVIGDLIIIKFFRSEISTDLNLVSQELHLQKINIFMKVLHIDFLVPLLGAIIVASPLPDELGLMMLGVSKLNYRNLAILSYILNTAGILLIVAPVNLLS